MTLAEAIEMGDMMQGVNSFDNDTKTKWICDLEGILCVDVHLLSIDEVAKLEYERDKDVVLSAKPPFDRVYWAYLCAMMDLANKEYDRYQNNYAVFNQFLTEYKIWYGRTYRPKLGRAVEMGYYLSAYLIAVSRGFRGTEEQWLDSLVGADGATFIPSVDASSGVLSWNNEDGLENPPPINIVELVLAAMGNPEGTLPYEGEYEITPSLVSEIILATANRYLAEDVVISPIPITREANNFGGETLYIG